MNRRMLIAAVPALALAAAFPARAQPGEVLSRDGIAIMGYDAVAYFSEGRARRGVSAHRLKWRGVIWFFSSEANRAAFEMNPRRYAPQYGGFCALAASGGVKAPASPEAWAIHDGKLYFTTSPGAKSVWESNPAAHVSRAEAMWPYVAWK